MDLKVRSASYPICLDFIHNIMSIDQQMKMTHMWPFRYFGINTNIGDILGKKKKKNENEKSQGLR